VTSLTGSTTQPSSASTSLPRLVARWLGVRTHLSERLFGGPRWLKFSWVINAQKGGTLFFVLALMAAFDVWTATAWTYAALHGSYGLVWLLKDRLFPDPNWEVRVTFGGAVASWMFVLGPYWIAPTLIVAGRHEAPPAVLGMATLLYAVGVVVMVGADAQKFFVLKTRKGLITDGFFARVRHPNYLGEMILYASFAIVAGHWAPWLVLFVVWTLVFIPNMLRKEASMARHADWAAYKERTGFLLPRLFAASAR
jgi:protein-S-isoprenylcysteine O-methyltransferase Ste14